MNCGGFPGGIPDPRKSRRANQSLQRGREKSRSNARLIATGADPDGFEKWNAAQLANPPRTFNYLSTHFVSPQILWWRATPRRHDRASHIRLTVELERRLRNHAQAIPDTDGDHQVLTAFTEWLFWAENDTVPRYDNMGGALATAGFLNMLLRSADIARSRT